MEKSNKKMLIICVDFNNKGRCCFDCIRFLDSKDPCTFNCSTLDEDKMECYQCNKYFLN